MLKYKPAESDIPAKAIEDYLFLYYKGIGRALGMKNFENARQTPLEKAIISERVVYRDGAFTGSFNASISRELSKVAEWRPHRHAWIVNAPLPVSLQEAINATATRQAAAYSAIRESFNITDAGIILAGDELDVALASFSSGYIPQVSERADKVVKQLGVFPKTTKRWVRSMTKLYVTDLRRGIKEWTDTEITSMRDEVIGRIKEGDSRKRLAEYLETQWGQAKNKAEFLARNETMLLSSTIRDDRYQQNGVKQFKWQASLDPRTRPLHRELNGKTFFYSSPPLIHLDPPKRGTPGKIYNCRCTAVPVL